MLFEDNQFVGYNLLGANLDGDTFRCGEVSYQIALATVLNEIKGQAVSILSAIEEHKTLRIIDIETAYLSCMNLYQVLPDKIVGAQLLMHVASKFKSIMEDVNIYQDYELIWELFGLEGYEISEYEAFKFSYKLRNVVPSLDKMIKNTGC